jgi:hypothetical protein
MKHEKGKSRQTAEKLVVTNLERSLEEGKKTKVTDG